MSEDEIDDTRVEDDEEFDQNLHSHFLFCKSSGDHLNYRMIEEVKPNQKFTLPKDKRLLNLAAHPSYKAIVSINKELL